ncbi:MAG: YheC/YheD family protein [Bacillota bacterium]
MLNLGKPIIGILVLPSYLKQHVWGSPPSSVPSLNVLAAEMVGASAYYFCLADVRGSQGPVSGLTRDSRGRWIRAWFPKPQVIYAQGGYPTDRDQQQTFRHLSRTAVKINSQAILPKWLCHQALSACRDVSGHLPETCRLISPRQVLQMLQRHRGVYIKLDRGAEGKEVYRVRTRSPGKYAWAASTGDTSEYILTEEHLRKHLQGLAWCRQFVVQQEVSLLTMADGRKADVRALMQKDGAGRWTVGQLGLRIGKPGSIVTNCFQGGEWLLIDEADQRAGWLEEERVLLRDRLADISLRLVQRLESQLGRMGEIGLDLAVGEKDRVWLLEANAKPDKDDYVPTEVPGSHFIRLMEYAKYLHQNRRSLRGR